MASNSLDRDWGDLRPTAGDSHYVARIKEVQFYPRLPHDLRLAPL